MKNKKNRPVNHITAGIQLGATIFVFMYIGYFFDSKYAKTPIFTVIGASLGMIIGFYLLLKSLLSKKTDEQEPSWKQSDDKDKWL